MRTRVTFGLVALFAAAGCTANTFGGGDGGSDNPPTVGGGGKDAGGGSDAAVPPGCDVTKLPTDDACVINDAVGIFVSSSIGTAVGDGTMAKPLGSLDVAIATAKTAGKRVYACAETYAEPITLENGVSVFGYFDCSKGWSVGTSHAKVQSPTSPAAKADNITSPTRVEAVDLVAPDFTDKSQSSIGLIANASPALTIVHATIHAGTGGKGDDGANGIQLTDSSGKNGGPSWSAGLASGSSWTWRYGGPAGGTNVCAGEAGHDPGAGGGGGAAGQYFSSDGVSWYAISSATAGNPTTGNAQTAQGGAVGAAGNPGTGGANGNDGTAGAAVGSLSTSGYQAGDGTAGTNGQPGQGGGGAGGFAVSNSDVTPVSQAYAWGESGGGGGAGGCPGLAAGPGKGGGASIAVIAVQSGLVLDHVGIETSSGGVGGSAGKRSLATPGGTGGVPAKHTQAGGNGGIGGHAGVSGNGGGGPSIGIAYQGTEPQMLASTVTPGTGGAGVAARVYVDGTVIPASPAGLSKDAYSF